MVRGNGKVVVWREFPSPTVSSKRQQEQPAQARLIMSKPTTQNDLDQKAVDRWIDLADSVIGTTKKPRRA